MQTKLGIGFIGAGNVGVTLARLLQNEGYEVVAVLSRTLEKAEALADAVGARNATDPMTVVEAAHLTFLTVNDDSIADVVPKLIGPLDGKAIIHTSGVHESNVLSKLSDEGAMIGGLHPIYPFADVVSSIAGLPGAVFGVQTNNSKLDQWLLQIVNDLNGTIIRIPPRGKALYHSAFVFASNFGVTLYAIAERLLATVGGDRTVLTRLSTR
ncbi:MAG: DUF2520 domain-containing protein [Anaerolineae bacterium]